MIVAKKAIEVLLVEDNPADVDLTREVLVQNNEHLQFSAVPDGEQAISFLHRTGRQWRATGSDSRAAGADFRKSKSGRLTPDGDASVQTRHEC